MATPRIQSNLNIPVQDVDTPQDGVQKLTDRFHLTDTISK